MVKMITVTFLPQAWVNDYAETVDPEGPTTFEVEAEALKDINPYSYEADDLRFHDNAYEWMQEWSGPFEIFWDELEVEEANS